MEKFTFRKSVRRVVRLSRTEDGGSHVAEIFRRTVDNETVDALEKATRRTVEAQRTLLDAYLERPERPAEHAGDVPPAPEAAAVPQPKTRKKAKKSISPE